MASPAFGEQIGDLPNPRPWPEATYTIARAGYEAYQAGRSARPWDALNPHEQHRWLMCGDFVLAYPGETVAAGIRAVYQVGMTQPGWDEVSRAYRDRWHAVAMAMMRTRLEIVTGIPAAPPKARTLTVPTPISHPKQTMREALAARREVSHA